MNLESSCVQILVMNQTLYKLYCKLQLMRHVPSLQLRVSRDILE